MSLNRLKEKAFKNENVKREYDALDGEFALVSSLIRREGMKAVDRIAGVMEGAGCPFSEYQRAILAEWLSVRDQQQAAEIERLRKECEIDQRNAAISQQESSDLLDKVKQLEQERDRADTFAEWNKQLEKERDQLKLEVVKLMALADIQYAEGAKRGFEWGQHDDIGRLTQCENNRVPEATRELNQLRQQTKDN